MVTEEKHKLPNTKSNAKSMDDKGVLLGLFGVLCMVKHVFWALLAVKLLKIVEPAF